MISMGIRHLDKLIDGLKLGDNVVWQIANAVPIEYFIRSFFNRSNKFQNSIVFVNFNYSPHTICRRFDDIFKNYNFILLDAFTHGKGNSDPVFLDFYRKKGDYDLSRILPIQQPRDIKAFTAAMNEIQQVHKDGTFYIFDSLTGMNELWKEERSVLEFFAFTCPKLYEMNTIAYWILEQEAHTKEFIAGLTHITQILIAVYNIQPEYYALEIQKLEDRPPFNLGTPHSFRIIDREIHFEDEDKKETLKIGYKLRDLRKASGITQSELAVRLGMTPGAVSQIENDLITPSLNTLIHIAKIFQKPIEYFISTSLTDNNYKGYRIFRKREAHHSTSKSLRITSVSDLKAANFRSYLITIGSSGTHEGPILLHKGKEFIIVVSGSLNCTVDGEEQLLRKGDSLMLDSSFVEKWGNRGKSDCEFIYMQF